MRTREALLLFILLNLSFSAYSGRMVASVEKEWLIESNGTLGNVLLNSSFLSESQYQRMTSMNVSDGELVRYGDEVRLIYRADSLNTPKRITATATIEVSYMPALPANPPHANISYPSTEFTNYTAEMAQFASSQTSSSSGQLHAAAILTDWVSKNVRYSMAFWGRDAPAQDTYAGREAVCVGYTHLLLALARSIGLESRYVSGYVFSDAWQEHAWAEFNIGGQWVPADPTFREFAFLDARHVASRYSDDQSGAVDRMSARGGDFSFSSITHILITESAPFPEQAAAYAAFDGTEFTVVVTNTGSTYFTPTLTATFPPYIHREERGILFLAPAERKTISYSLDTSSLGGGGYYTVPYIISMQGTEISDDITVSRFQQPAPGSAASSSACPVALALLASLFIAIARYKPNV
ncbi:MAG: transglutaminase-like domain-containing protein [Candidatus ainarchaeum sp.]|nr:transglutaminase-like domain-containing protein [Candidatus ainarchaeum sp.]MDD5096055.1 transglutaminase-like domain-containing protein [Candidatus ainarchaeum sp.]